MRQSFQIAAAILFGAFPACAQSIPFPGPGGVGAAGGCTPTGTYALVGHATQQGGNVTGTTNCTGTNLQVVARSWFNGSGAPNAPNDTSATNTYTQIGTAVDMGNGTKVDLWYTVATNGAGSWQWGYVGGVPGGFPATAGACFSLSAGTATFDQHAETGASDQPGSVTPTVNGGLLVTGYVPDDSVSGSTLTINSSFTITDQGSHGSNEGIGLAYRVLATCAATNPTWTVSNGTKVGAANIGTFK